MIGTVVQMIFVAIVYVIVISHSIRTGPVQAALLNRIVTFDNRIAQQVYGHKVRLDGI